MKFDGTAASGNRASPSRQTRFEFQIRLCFRLFAQFGVFGFGELSPPNQLAQLVLNRLVFHRVLQIKNRSAGKVALKTHSPSPEFHRMLLSKNDRHCRQPSQIRGTPR